MKRMVSLFGLLVGLLLALPHDASALSYTANYTGSCMSSITIAAATSGVTSQYYAVRIYSAYGDNSTRVGPGKYTASINTSTYALTLSSFDATVFPNGFCGGVRINGMFGANDTANAGDFEATALTGGAQVGHASTYSQRTVNGRTYASDVDGSAYGDGTGFGGLYCTGTVRAYFDYGTSALVFAHSVGTACLIPTNARVTNANSYPANSVHLGTFSVTYVGNSPSFSRTSDDRPW